MIMEKDNFTSQYLGLLKRSGKIRELVGGGVPINTIKFSYPLKSFPNNNPVVVYDRFDKEESLVEPEIKEINTFKKVEELGLKIISSKVSKRWKRRQSVEYKLKKEDVTPGRGVVIKKIPIGHKLLFDYANLRARLVGENCRDSLGIKGQTNWISLKKETFRKDRKKTPEEIWSNMFGSPEVFLGNRNRKSVAKILDIPIMVKPDGTIVCIPHRHEPNNILVLGKKGSGKSLLLNRLKSEIFFLWNECPVIMNDLEQECIAWSRKLENERWGDYLSIIGEKPQASPIVYVYPHTSELKIDYSSLKEEINFIETTLPFSELMNNAEVYLKLKSEEGTIRYVWDMKNEFLRCGTPEEVIEVIEGDERYGVGGGGKKYETMRNKMIAGFNNVFVNEIFNITNPEYPFEISETLNGITGNPFVILIKAGVIPCFETYDLFNKRYLPEVMSYHLDTIFKEKYPGGILERETVHIIFDELTQICDDGNKNSAHYSLCTIATRGRKMGLAIIGATQNYSKVPQKIKSNTDFVFAFKHSNSKEVNLIGGDFELNSLDKEDILNLNDLEIVAITNQHFVCYYRDKRWIPEEKIIKGTLIPPTSNHYYPKDKLK